MEMMMRYFLLFFFITSNLFAQGLSDKELRDLRGSTSASCVTSQRSSQINSTMSDARIRYYCSCYAQELLPDNLSMATLQSALKALQKSGNEAMLNVFLNGRSLYAISNSCSAQAMQYAK